MRFFTICFILFVSIVWTQARSRPAVDICDRKPTINGLCVTSTLGIYYDAETQRCRYMGCSPDKKLFSSLEDCDKICNSKRRRNRRVRYS
ncbi:kappaPI-actitoxin-Ael3a [Haematobia irritans]|uniref:kappaPI-actitoxin-Ael3a n=1 Tax=Haematobia irritans TaxID=7368 RepID=UPI003F508136